MLSYLHGIRPNSRRSAIPQAVPPPQNTSSRYYHQGSSPTQGPPTPHLDRPGPRTSYTNSLDGSPVSANPPILPPIPRVASHRESERPDELYAWARGEGSAPSIPQRQPPQLSSSVPPVPVTSNAHSTSVAPTDGTKSLSEVFVMEKPSTGLDHVGPEAPVSRPKRPIDVAYESMRSYGEQPYRQSLGTQSEIHPYIPEPLRRPPPPPSKTSPLGTEPQQHHSNTPGKVVQQAQPATVQNRHGKARLNLLNPMSLLARRRSSQAVEEAYSQSQVTSGLRLPDDYDPRIRGKVVHDFSAPRPGRNNSSGESSMPPSQLKENRGSLDVGQKRLSPNPAASLLDDESPSSTEREHTPVFKENFGDDIQPWHDDLDSPAKRRASAFMYKMSLQEHQPEPNPSSLPAFARSLPPKVPPKDVQAISNAIDAIQKASSPSPRPPLEKVLENPLPNQESAKPYPPMSPPKARSRSTSLSDTNLDGPGSPRRYKSNASRFSFDLAGVGSAAQEQLLEERHRQQKAKRIQRESVLSDGNESHDEDDYADFDGMDDDGDEGLEEKIPGVNADDEDSEMPLMQQATEISFISPNKSSFDSVSGPVSTSMTSPGTPFDSQSHQNGIVDSDFSQKLVQNQQLSQNWVSEKSLRPKSVPGVPSHSDFDAQPLPREIASESNLAGLPSRYENQDDDDLYFDDGMIEDLGDEENQGFDESVFDDDTSRVYGLPLRDLKSLPVAQNSNNLMASQAKGHEVHLVRQSSSNHGIRDPTLPESIEDEDTAAELMDSVADLKQPTRGSLSQATGLTQDNLGLHDQLAMAANQAELAGRFERSYSLASTHASNDGFSSLGQTRPHYEQLNIPPKNVGSTMGDEIEDLSFDDAHIGFDDEEADDTIIAAANAEALENDDDGFYGQEFGFFARASGSSESEYVNGGYFGSRALEGIHRMNSGRENKDPSLTPITERSEWSNRNSAISLAMHGYPLSAQYPSNPQLASLMNVPEDEMSLEALRKLRRGAWGGSEGSSQSSNNSQNSGSPLTYAPGIFVPSLLQPANSNGPSINASNQNLASSFHSFSSSNGHLSSADSDPSPLLESPTITLSTSQPGLYIQQPMAPPPPPPADTSPVRRNAGVGKVPWTPSHSRNSSGAESVSYREEGGKWICEKRRMDVTGEMEVLGRSFVEAGRI